VKTALSKDIVQTTSVKTPKNSFKIIEKQININKQVEKILKDNIVRMQYISNIIASGTDT
jgi:hypothetical protein